MAQVKKDEVRKRILDGAEQLFGERGFADTTLRAISKTASVSLANVYNYFGGKDELFEAVLAPTVDFVARALEEARTREDPEGFDCLLPDANGVEAIVAFVDGHRHALGLLLFRSEGSRLHHWEDGVIDELTELWEERLRRQTRRGPSRFLLHHLASWAVQSLAEFVMHEISPVEMGEHLRELLRFSEAGLGACKKRRD